MLATLTERRFSDPDWIFERKLDGERCLAFRSPRELRLLSRNRLRIDGSYPEVAGALAGQDATFVIDGEIVAFQDGQTSFARLQQRMKIRAPAERLRAEVAVFYYVFDLLWLDGRDVRPLPLRERKRLLRVGLTWPEPVRLTPHRNREGEAFYEEACRKGWEGVIAKRADAPYASGRSKDWLKFKCGFEQELVIGGFTDPQGSRTGFGALLVGYYEGGRLRFAGKVGTGFDHGDLESMTPMLAARERPDPPFVDPSARRKGVHWVEPELVAEVAFSEWTRDGRLRHPRFLGLRRDKAAREVARERPQA
jgi:bifunctional non-homologous end joining protein LigD